MKTMFRIFIFTLMVSIAPSSFAEDKKVNEDVPDVSKITKQDVLKVEQRDIIIGDKDAPITIFEYASLSCSHCAQFHTEILPKLKEKYLDTGKAKLVFRDFPLNLQALRASMLVRCVPEEKQKAFLSTLFKTLEKWAYERDFQERLVNIAKIGGFPEDRVKQCFEDKEVEKSVLDNRFIAAKVLEISSTPSFVINGTKLPNFALETFDEALSGKADSE